MEKVLILSNCELAESQGSGYIIVNTARGLSELGYQVDIIPPSQLSIFSSWKSTAVIYRMALGILKWCILHQKKLKSVQLIIFYGAECVLGFFFIKKILKLKTPVVLHSNGLELHVEYRLHSFRDFLPNKKQKWYHFNISKFFEYCYNGVDAIITLSKYDKDYAVNFLKVNPNKITYLEPCLPKEFFKYSEQDMNIKDKIITFCGTWIIRKGVESVKMAIPKILRQYPEFRFRIIGVGKDFFVEEHFPLDILQRIEVIPLVTNKDDLIKLYIQSSIFLFPSFCESFGLVVAETMFCKCAVITGPTGIAADLNNGSDVLILPTPTGAFVYEALEKLISNPLLVEKLSTNAHNRVKNLKWENYNINLQGVINAILLSEPLPANIIIS